MTSGGQERVPGGHGATAATPQRSPAGDVPGQEATGSGAQRGEDVLVGVVHLARHAQALLRGAGTLFGLAQQAAPAPRPGAAPGA
ncbi:hypothetical protein [Microbispora hainanensis]|uniref:hypothetical protein n=1 Tax=Microbispora hainanensis TaxID=568844 RepID=UPI001FCB6F7F|nr:hypothetical protein [Microbispora hainanensis]